MRDGDTNGDGFVAEPDGLGVCVEFCKGEAEFLTPTTKQEQFNSFLYRDSSKNRKQSVPFDYAAVFAAIMPDNIRGSASWSPLIGRGSIEVQDGRLKTRWRWGLSVGMPSVGLEYAPDPLVEDDSVRPLETQKTVFVAADGGPFKLVGSCELNGETGCSGTGLLAGDVVPERARAKVGFEIGVLLGPKYSTVFGD